MAIIWKGSEVASALLNKCAIQTQNLSQNGIVPTLAIVRIGSQESDIAYERSAKKKCEKAGIAVNGIALPGNISQEELKEEIQKLNNNSSVHGVLILRPLPKGIDEGAVSETLDPAKDVDGITSASLTGVFTGFKVGFPPCTAQAVMEMLKYYQVDVQGKRVVVVGRSLVVGKPVAMMLLEQNATVTMCHSRTRDLETLCKQADILVVAIGKPNFISRQHLTDSQIVLDVGINVIRDG
jgi:methylenetetrahydrofolate dehydrogenase (NADP+)/methenyltetrahydrofolate cyclohydrolase